MTGGSTGFLKMSEGCVTSPTSKPFRFQSVNLTSTVTQNNDHVSLSSINKEEPKTAQQPYPPNSPPQKGTTPWTPSWYAQRL